MTKGAIWYSDCLPDSKILDASRLSVERSGLPIVAVTLKPIDWPAARAIVLDKNRGILTMFEQILAGLEALTTDVAFLTEHDVLYAPDHFQFTPSRDDCFYYNAHIYKVDAVTGKALHYRCNQTSGLCASRALLLEHYTKRVRRVEAEGYSSTNGFEPGTRKIRHGGFDDHDFESWMSAVPNVDIRHGVNLTRSRWTKAEFRNQKYTEGWTEASAIPGWPGVTVGRFDDWLREAVSTEVSHA